MSDNAKTKKQLIQELQALRQQIAELQESEKERGRAETELLESEGQQSFVNIAERKQAKEALRISEERMVMAVQGTSDGLWDWDILNNSLYWSPRLKEWLGYADDELHVDLDTFNSLLHPDDRERIGAALQAHLKDHVPYDVELRQRTKSGEYRWFRYRGTAIWDENGRPIRMAGFSTDITDRKQTEEALRASEEKYRTILENIQEGYFEVDLAGNLTFFNDALGRITGYPRDELMGMNNREYMDAENAKAVYQAFNAIYRTKRPSQTVNYEIIRKDGTRRSAEVSASLITNSRGEPIGFRGMMRDVTERKRVEETLERRALQLQTAAEVSRAASSILNVD